MVKHKPTVALFGGSFDPPHKGHQAIAKEVASFDDIDKLIIMPAYLNPFKKDTVASGQKRFRWCQQACAGEKIIVSDFEILQKRPVYTIDTLRKLTEKYSVKYLVIGSDNLAQIEKWHEFETINKMVIWIVFTRDGAQADCHMLKRYRILALNITASSTEIRKGNGMDHIDGNILTDVKQTILKDKNDN